MNKNELEIKEKISALSKEELEELLMKMYRNNSTVEQGLGLLFNEEDNGEKILKKAQEQLKDIFKPYDGAYSFEEVTPILEEVKNVSLADPEIYGEVLLFTIECAVERARTFMYIPDNYYYEFELVIKELMKILENDKDLFDRWKSRLEVLVEPDVNETYHGTKDYVEYEYRRLPWVEQEEDD